MNREKYMNDMGYREGYDDGRKEGSNSVATTTMVCLNKLTDDIEYMKKLLSDTINNEETIVETNKE
jgi:hypothetical protein